MHNSRSPGAAGKGSGRINPPAKVRNAKVYKARELIKDTHYPDEKVIRAVAKHLAKKWY